MNCVVRIDVECTDGPLIGANIQPCIARIAVIYDSVYKCSERLKLTHYCPSVIKNDELTSSRSLARSLISVLD